MADLVTISPKDIFLNTNRVRKIFIAQGDKVDEGVFSKGKIVIKEPSLYDIINDHDKKDPLIRANESSTIQLTIQEAFAIYFSVHDRLDNIFSIDTHEKDLTYDKSALYNEKLFINAYSMYVASNYIMNKIKPILDQLDKKDLHPTENICQFDFFSKSEEDVVRDYKSMMIAAFNHYFTDDKGQKVKLIRDIKDFWLFTYEFFDSVSQKCVQEKERFPTLEDKIKGTSIEVNGAVISGFENNSSKGEGTKVAFEKLSYDDIVGNEEAKEVLEILTNAVLKYDPAKKSNIFYELGLKGKTGLFYGQPGTGKTMLLKAAVSYVDEMCKKYNKPFKWINITNSDIKSKWFGESTKMLRDMLAQATKGDSIAIVTIEDIDAIFSAREELKDQPAEKELLQELLNTLEGMLTSETGNYLLLATSNRPANLDGALGQRLKDNQAEVPGPRTIEEYAKVMQLCLKKGIKSGAVCNEDGSKITDEQWQKIGETFVNAKERYNEISGRSVEKIAASLSKGFFKFLRGADMDEMMAIEGDEAKAYVKGKMGKVTYEMILKGVEKYVADGLKQEDVKINESVNKRAKELVDAAKARVKVLEDRAYMAAEREVKRLELEQDNAMKEYVSGEFRTAFIDSFIKGETQVPKETLEILYAKIGEKLSATEAPK